jgi:hypothetical protein
MERWCLVTLFWLSVNLQAVVQPLMMVTLLATMLTPLFLYIFVAK